MSRAVHQVHKTKNGIVYTSGSIQVADATETYDISDLSKKRIEAIKDNPAKAKKHMIEKRCV